MRATAPSQGIVIACDFGMREIGLAVGDLATEDIDPAAVVRAKKGRPVWSGMDRMHRLWQPLMWVVGLPLHMDGRPSWMSRRAENFASTLRKRYGLPVEMQDERLSTQSVLDMGVRAPSEVHSVSAAVILADWFRQRARSGGSKGE
ncbi:MAG: Holliday junction resolvase RuvX [Gammaproteobacteria bacterium]